VISSSPAAAAGPFTFAGRIAGIADVRSHATNGLAGLAAHLPVLRRAGFRRSAHPADLLIDALLALFDRDVGQNWFN